VAAPDGDKLKGSNEMFSVIFLDSLHFRRGESRAIFDDGAEQVLNQGLV